MAERGTDTSLLYGGSQSTLRTPLVGRRSPSGGRVYGSVRDPRYKCMACQRKPSEYLVDEQASDGGWLWVCGQCQKRKGWAVIGRVGVMRI